MVRLISFFVSLFNRLWRIQPEQRFRTLAPIGPAANRESRKTSRRAWWLFRFYDQRIGPPVLKGDRLFRAIKSCRPSNLTVQPRYRRTA